MALVTLLPRCCYSWKQVAPHFRSVHAALKESTYTRVGAANLGKIE
jgi:hypothetical protein